MADDLDDDARVRATRRDMLDRLEALAPGTGYLVVLTVGQRRGESVELIAHGVADAVNQPRYWPHLCGDPYDDDDCQRIPFDLDGDPQLEAFCGGDADPEAPVDTFHEVLAIAREGQRPTLGPLLRPALDLPRTPTLALESDNRLRTLVYEGTRAGSYVVLGDELMQRGDPRGRLFTDPVDDAGIGRSWLGSWARHVPRSALSLRDGVPYEFSLFIDRERMKLFPLDHEDSLPWTFAPRVRFLAGSCVPDLAHLRMCRALLGPMNLVDFMLLLEVPGSFDAEELELDRGFDAKLLVERFPKLRTLRVRNLVSPVRIAEIRKLLPNVELVT